MMSEQLEELTPQKTFARFIELIQNREGEASWGMLSKATQEQLSVMFSVVAAFAEGVVEAAQEMTGMSADQSADVFPDSLQGKKFWIDLITEGKQEGNPAAALQDTSIESEMIKGDMATLTIKSKEGKEDKITLLREDGIWRINLAGAKTE